MDDLFINLAPRKEASSASFSSQPRGRGGRGRGGSRGGGRGGSNYGRDRNDRNHAPFQQRAPSQAAAAPAAAAVPVVSASSEWDDVLGTDRHQNQQHGGAYRRKIGKVESIERAPVADAPKKLATHQGTKTSQSDTFTSTMFSESPLADVLKNHITGTLGFQQMTHIQFATIPPMIKGSDVLMRARTGTGKTLAFSIPIVEMLTRPEKRVDRSEGTRALIIAPTRELCLQIEQVAISLLKPFHWIVHGVTIGGEKKKSEKARLRKGVTILVGTPGRLLDHLQSTQSFSVKNLQFLVLDEADRLLDLGFEENVLQIIQLIDEKRRRDIPKRQTVLVSATLDSRVKQLASKVLYNPKTVSAAVGEGGNNNAAPVERQGGVVVKGGARGLEEVNDDTLTAAEKKRIAALSANEKSLQAELLKKAKSEGVDGDDFEIVDASSSGQKRKFFDSDDEEENNGKKKNDDDDDDDDNDSVATDPSSSFDLPSNLRQHFAVVPCKQRLSTLASFLRGRSVKGNNLKCLVFCCSISVAEAVYLFLSRAWVPSWDHRGGGGGEEQEKKDWTTAGWMQEGFGGKRHTKRRNQEEDEEDDEHNDFFDNQAKKNRKNRRFGVGGDKDEEGIKVDALLPVPLFLLHGEMAQQERTKQFFAFSHAPSGVMICTDIAARGLDFPSVDWIIQYDCPTDIREYIHRVGRTARISHDGDALLFLMPHEKKYVNVLKKAGLHLEEIEHEMIIAMLLDKANIAPVIGKRKENLEKATYLQRKLQHQFEDMVSTDENANKTATKAFESFVRAYATFPKSLKSIFHVNQLHLGHLAASFGLRDAPKKLSSMRQNMQKKAKKQRRK